MAKDPSVLLYTQDFLVGSSVLTPIQKGHYITLLCHQQQSETGSLLIEDIQQWMNGDFDSHWPAISRKFKKDDNGFYNARMREEIAKRKKFSQSRSDNRRKKTSVEDINNISKSCDGHMENENANEIVNRDLRKESVKENHQRVEHTAVRGEITYNAEATILDNMIEFERICMNARLPQEVARDALHSYHLYMSEKERYPVGRKAAFDGFERWAMNEKKFNNGTVKNNHGKKPNPTVVAPGGFGQL